MYRTIDRKEKSLNLTSAASKKSSSSDIIYQDRFHAEDLSKGPRTSTRDSFQGWKWFFELLRNSQHPRLLSGDAVEFLSRLPSDKVKAIIVNLNTTNFFGITENHYENPYGEKNINPNYQSLPGGYESEITGRYHDDNGKEDLFEKCLTTSDVGDLGRLVVEAGKYFLLATILEGTDSLLRLEDEEGKAWLFEFSYHNVSQCYEFTKGWRCYVEEKQLGAGDFVFFQRNSTDSNKLFIGCRKSGYGGATPGNDANESFPSAVLNSTSPVTSNQMLELRDKLKDVEIPFQSKLPEHSITGFNPILVISCGDNQDSEETYFISYIFNDLCLRGFAPLRYDIKKSSVTENLIMLYRSRVSIIIFSMNLAHSRECLDGIVAIMDHLKANGLVLIPVFFKVSLSDVRGQRGSFEKELTRLGNSVQASQVLKWRAAMIELTSIKRYQYRKGNEVMLAKNIVRDVCLLLSSETNKTIIGMGVQLRSILSLLNFSQSSAPHIVGLWGMAGIGKTTITREIFRTQAERYDVCYFLPNFHLMCQTKGLSHLREEFFSKIFGEEKVFIDACDANLSFTRDRFLGKKVLIVLDGVSTARDAEVLVGGFGWFSGGHTIILTSRNRQVLVQCNAKEIYDIQKLSEPESLHLCCQFATEENWKGRMPLISELVNYANGNPLALRVLALSIQKQFINDGKQHLRRLRQHPPIKIQDAFRISFNARDDDEKSIFLDLACFFRGEDKNHVLNILDGCGFFTDLGVCGLIDESLISLVDNKIEMPNIFQDAGRFVVCQEHEEAGKRSRLWDSNDIFDVLTNNSGTEAIEGIFLDASSLTFDLSSTVFERMYRLRLLKLHYPTYENHCKVCLPQGLHSLPDELRLLHWERYPLGSLPRNFNPKDLVELNMPFSNLTKLWKGTKNLKKLKRIILSHSRQLTKFPRLSKARNLEHIDLEGCTSLVKVNSSIIHHQKLTFLSLKDCSHLRVMPTTVHLECLEVLNLSGCSELEDLQDFSPNLKELYLAGTAIREMPSSLEDLTRLVTLDLENCEKLQHLPPGISNLKAMMTLNLSGCSNLQSLPILDVFLRHSQRLNKKITMEVSVPLNLQSAVQESRLDGAKIQRSLSSPSFSSPPSSTAATTTVDDQEVKSNSALKIANARLQEEFRNILLSQTSAFEPDSLFREESSVSSHSTRTEVGEDTAVDVAEEDEDSNPVYGSGSNRLSRRRGSYRSTSSIREMDLISPEAVSDLRSIVQRMIAAGYSRECIQVYGSVRKSAMETIFKQLGILNMSIGDVQSLEWEVVEGKIRSWIHAAKVCIRIVFSTEKRLCEEIFGGICASMDETCFMETVKTSALRLFTFPEAISISRRSPENFFKILDLHNAMSDMLPDIEAIFDSDLFNSIRGQAAEIQARLAEAARGILFEFENAVLREPSVLPVPGGNIHSLTRYVMNYISLICDYKQPLNDLIMSNPSTGSDPNTPVMDFTDLEGKSPLALHLIWLIVLLHFKLEEKSHHYRDTSLAHIFIMNNIHYIVQKVKQSPELREMIGDHYIRKLTGIFRHAATNYQRSTWARVLNSLRDEELHVSGSFSSGVSKNAPRERFKAFNAMFEEIHRTQSTWSVPDAQLREELRISLSEHLIPAYRSFLGRFRGHIKSGRHPENYLKYSVEDIERIVLDFFEGYTAPFFLSFCPQPR